MCRLLSQLSPIDKPGFLIICTSYSLLVQRMTKKDRSSSDRLRLFLKCIHMVRSWETQ